MINPSEVFTGNHVHISFLLHLMCFRSGLIFLGPFADHDTGEVHHMQQSSGVEASLSRFAYLGTIARSILLLSCLVALERFPYSSSPVCNGWRNSWMISKRMHHEICIVKRADSYFGTISSSCRLHRTFKASKQALAHAHTMDVHVVKNRVANMDSPWVVVDAPRALRDVFWVRCFIETCSVFVAYTIYDSHWIWTQLKACHFIYPRTTHHFKCRYWITDAAVSREKAQRN